MDEFTKAIDPLKASGKFEYPIDVNAQNTGEWWPYAYSPMLQSFGGDLAEGVRRRRTHGGHRPGLLQSH